MRLYHMPRSRSTRVLWTLEEIGVPYELTVVTGDERKSPEHMARHPLGRVPVFERDDGGMMFESAAICLHLADSYPEAGLAPPLRTPERALLYQWCFFAMTELEPPVIQWSRARHAGVEQHVRNRPCGAERNGDHPIQPPRQPFADPDERGDDGWQGECVTDLV
jgi:glutathione S-transferase